MDGGELVAEVLKKHDIKFLFTLCGGHISPILVHSKQKGIKIIDVRHEANAVFAADAVARLTGIPGVAAVTAGPGVTNTITAVRNALMAQSPLVLLGGASATILRGRGSLQDIDQISIMKPNVKWCKAVKKVNDIVPTLTEAFKIAKSGVPGPVFVELPIDLLYPENIVREWYGTKTGSSKKNFVDQALSWYIKRHLDGLFADSAEIKIPAPHPVTLPEVSISFAEQVAKQLRISERPVMVLGSQTVLEPSITPSVVKAVEKMGIPVYLSGMARGLLGGAHYLNFRHNRKNALREADFVMLVGVPCDFRLDYGNHISKKAFLVSVNRSTEDLNKNRKANLSDITEPGNFIRELSKLFKADKNQISGWFSKLVERENSREMEITSQSEEIMEKINPLNLCKEINKNLNENSIVVVDGGDFAATGAYIIHPRKPLSWLDPGVFGTLGVGAGFALGAKLCRPDAEVWIIYGDGSVGYSIAEYDTFVRHNIGIISVVGNDSGWSQIARDQVEILKDPAGTELRQTDYHTVAKGFGGDGEIIDSQKNISTVINQAKVSASNGVPFLINAVISKTEFRKGSISV